MPDRLSFEPSVLLVGEEGVEELETVIRSEFVTDRVTLDGFEYEEVDRRRLAEVVLVPGELKDPVSQKLPNDGVPRSFSVGAVLEGERTVPRQPRCDEVVDRVMFYGQERAVIDDIWFLSMYSRFKRRISELYFLRVVQASRALPEPTAHRVERRAEQLSQEAQEFFEEIVEEDEKLAWAAIKMSEDSKADVLIEAD